MGWSGSCYEYGKESCGRDQPQLGWSDASEGNCDEGGTVVISISLPLLPSTLYHWTRYDCLGISADNGGKARAR